MRLHALVPCLSLALTLFACSDPPALKPTVDGMITNVATGKMTPDQLRAEIAKGLDVNGVGSSGVTPLDVVLTMARTKKLELVTVLLEGGAIPSAKHVQLAGMSGDAALAKLVKDKAAGATPAQKAKQASGEKSAAVQNAKAHYEKKGGVMGSMPWGGAIAMKMGKGYRTIGTVMASMYTDGLSGARYAFDDAKEWKDWPVEKSNIQTLADGKSSFGGVTVKGKHTTLRIKLVYADGSESAARSYPVQSNTP